MKKRLTSLSTRYQWAQGERGLTFRLLTLSAFFYNLGISIIFFLYGLFLLGLGWREHAIGMTAGSLVLGGVAGVVPMASLTRRYGFRVTLSGSLLASAAALAMRTVLLNYPAQLTLSFIAGVGLAGWIVCVSPAIANSVEPADRPAAFSVLFAVAVGAGGLGGILGGYLPGILERRGVSFFHLASATVLDGATQSKGCTLLLGCGLLGLAAVPALRLAGGTAAIDIPRPVRRNAMLVRCVVASACWSIAVGLFNPFAGLFFVRQFAVPIGRLSLIFLVAQFAQSIALLSVNDRLQKRLGLMPALVTLQIAGGLTLMMLARGSRPVEAAVLYSVFMVVQRLCDPILQCALMNATPMAERSMATAMFYFAWSGTQALSADLGGAALQRFGYAPVTVAAGIAAVAAAGSSAVLLRRLAKPVEEVTSATNLTFDT